MKILFISEYICAKGQGAYMLSNSHYQSFCDLFGKENIDVVAIKTSDDENVNDKFIYLSGYRNRKDRFINLLCGYPNFYSKRIKKDIIKLIGKNAYNMIFFDNSYFGTTIRKIKKMYPGIPVLTFFHGVKANSGRQIIKNENCKPQNILTVVNNIKQEKKTTKYSDICILLNKREEEELIKYYNRKADLFLPIYYIDTAKIENIKVENEFRILFVGGKFWPNILGIKWFANNVMPYLENKAKLYIVGKNMEELKNDIDFKDKKNIKVVGGTADLGYWYNSSDLVVGPIFHGDGMKTKTAEALMYGKRFIGTKEALCGYENMEEFCCNTSEEFINLINQYIKEGINKYYPEMRLLYEQNYSVKSANDKINTLIKKMRIEHEN